MNLDRRQSCASLPFCFFNLVIFCLLTFSVLTISLLPKRSITRHQPTFNLTTQARRCESAHLTWPRLALPESEGLESRWSLRVPLYILLALPTPDPHAPPPTPPARGSGSLADSRALCRLGLQHQLWSSASATAASHDNSLPAELSTLRRSPSPFRNSPLRSHHTSSACWDRIRLSSILPTAAYHGQRPGKARRPQWRRYARPHAARLYPDSPSPRLCVTWSGFSSPRLALHRRLSPADTHHPDDERLLLAPLPSSPTCLVHGAPAEFPSARHVFPAIDLSPRIRPAAEWD